MAVVLTFNICQKQTIIRWRTVRENSCDIFTVQIYAKQSFMTPYHIQDIFFLPSCVCSRSVAFQHQTTSLLCTTNPHQTYTTRWLLWKLHKPCHLESNLEFCMEVWIYSCYTRSWPRAPFTSHSLLDSKPSCIQMCMCAHELTPECQIEM